MLCHVQRNRHSPTLLVYTKAVNTLSPTSTAYHKPHLFVRPHDTRAEQRVSEQQSFLYYSNPTAAYGGYYLDTSERRWTPWLVPLFVLINVILFIVTMYVNNCPRHEGGRNCVTRFLGRLLFQPLRENPLFGPSSPTLERMGALEWLRVVHRHQGWRLFTSIWLHAGVVHLLVNMLSLVLIGIRLEQQFGSVRIGIIYILSGIAGSVLSSLFIRRSISVGASGTLFGLLGAMLSELITNWTLYSNKAAALLSLLVVIVINLAIGILPHVDNFAYIGGLLAGFLLGFFVLMRPRCGWVESQNLQSNARVTSKYKDYQYVLALIAVVLFIAGFVVGLVMLFRGENGYDHCHWCR